MADDEYWDDEEEAFALSFLTESQGLTHEQALAKLEEWKANPAPEPSMKTPEQIQELQDFVAKLDAEFYARHGTQGKLKNGGVDSTPKG